VVVVLLLTLTAYGQETDVTRWSFEQTEIVSASGVELLGVARERFGVVSAKVKNAGKMCWCNTNGVPVVPVAVSSVLSAAGAYAVVPSMCSSLVPYAMSWTQVIGPFGSVFTSAANWGLAAKLQQAAAVGIQLKGALVVGAAVAVSHVYADQMCECA